MTQYTRGRVIAWSLVAVGLVIAGTARADSLPKGEEILDKYVEATGGKANYEKIKNQIAKGTMEIAALGIKGNLTIVQAVPNKMYMEVDLAGVGKIESGTDGQVAWEQSAISGTRIKEGDERAKALRDAQLHAGVNWRKNYKKAECVGEEMVDGKPAYKVQLTTPEGQMRTQYFDKQAHLLVKTTSKEKSPMGEIAVEAYPSDYKTVDGVLIPHVIKQKAVAQEILITINKVEHNVQLPADRFALPEDVKKLADKEKDSKPEK